jgi:hypothetical protein
MVLYITCEIGCVKRFELVDPLFLPNRMLTNGVNPLPLRGLTPAVRSASLDWAEAARRAALIAVLR